MDENSKELAHAGAFGVRLTFHSFEGMTGRRLGNLIGEVLLDGSRTLTVNGALLGHVKAIARMEAGFVKVSLVDLRLGPDLDTNIARKKVTQGTINLMAAVSGRNDKDVRHAIEMMISKLSEHLDIERERSEEKQSQIVELR